MKGMHRWGCVSSFVLRPLSLVPPSRRPILITGGAVEPRRPRNGGRRGVRREYNVLALIKGNERYVFVYDDESRQELIDTFRDQAADPRLNLNWFDAAVLTEKARAQARQNTASPPLSRARM